MYKLTCRPKSCSVISYTYFRTCLPWFR